MLFRSGEGEANWAAEPMDTEHADPRENNAEALREKQVGRGACLSACLCLSLSVSVCLSVCLSACLSVYLSVSLSYACVMRLRERSG